jgi:hypothetical protein
MPLKLVCHFSYVFDQDAGHALYTPGGQSSWRAWWDAGHGGLTAKEPEIPNRPVRYRVEGDLRDGGDFQKWKIEYSEMR